MEYGLLFAYAGCFLLSLILSLGLTPVFRMLARRVGLVDKPGERKIHEKVTPYGGGLAMATAFFVTLGTILFILAACPWAEGCRHALTFSPDMISYSTLLRVAGVGVGALAMVVLGVWDDRRGLSFRIKFAVQIAAAAGLFFSGTRITLFVQSEVISFLLTVLWVVGITNAMNLLDNMDGLCAGVTAIAGAIFFVIAVQTQQPMLACVLAALVGCAAGFLAYNFAPASVFMGDSGSLFLGFMLAATSISGTYYPGKGHGFSVAIPVVILAIPLFDTFSVMLIRWWRGKPLFHGDTNHFSHRLVRLGMTRRMAVLTIYMLTLALGVLAPVLPQLSGADGLLAILHTAGILIVIGILEYTAAGRDHADNT